MPQSEWFYSHDGENYYGAADRDDAIAQLDGEGGYVGQGWQEELMLSEHFDACMFLENAEETVYDRGQGDPEGGIQIFKMSKDQEKALQVFVRQCLDIWQGGQKLIFNSWGITWNAEPEYIQPEPDLYEAKPYANAAGEEVDQALVDAVDHFGRMA